MCNLIYKIFILFLVVFFFQNCTERKRENPLDPETNNIPDIHLTVLSYSDRIELNWNKINLYGFEGFNLYRKAQNDSSFLLYEFNLNSNLTSYTDFNIILNKEYFYYMTILGEQGESAPSKTVSITTGMGFNWVIDKWGYQLVKITYDGKYLMDRYFTGWPPFDFAIDTIHNSGLISFPSGGRIDLINLSAVNVIDSWDRGDFNFIQNPYKVEFESNSNYFWVSDSGGTIYRISAINHSFELISTQIFKPGNIFMNEMTDEVYIIDDKSNDIYIFSFEGNLIRSFSEIGNHEIHNPQTFIMDNTSDQFWLVEEISQIYHLYSGNLNNAQFSKIDSFEYIYDLKFDPLNQVVWVVVYEDGISKILQLSKAGNRQLELKGFFNPKSVTINPYDGTLLVADSGNGRIIHYNGDFEKIGIFTKLNFPINLNVE